MINITYFIIKSTCAGPVPAGAGPTHLHKSFDEKERERERERERKKKKDRRRERADCQNGRIACMQNTQSVTQHQTTHRFCYAWTCLCVITRFLRRMSCAADLLEPHVDDHGDDDDDRDAGLSELSKL